MVTLRKQEVQEHKPTKSSGGACLRQEATSTPLIAVRTEYRFSGMYMWAAAVKQLTLPNIYLLNSTLIYINLFQ